MTAKKKAKRRKKILPEQFWTPGPLFWTVTNYEDGKVVSVAVMPNRDRLWPSGEPRSIARFARSLEQQCRALATYCDMLEKKP